MSQDQKSVPPKKITILFEENHNFFQERSYQIDMKRHKCSMHHPNIENNLLDIINIEYDSDDDDDDDDDFDSKVFSIKSL